MRYFFNIVSTLVLGFSLLLSPQLLHAKDKSIPTVVNINAGDVSSISTLPGIGKSTAEKIIKYRDEHGNFKKKEDLTQVKGIGSKKFEKIKSLIVLSDDENTKKSQEKKD